MHVGQDGEVERRRRRGRRPFQGAPVPVVAAGARAARSRVRIETTSWTIWQTMPIRISTAPNRRRAAATAAIPATS